MKTPNLDKLMTQAKQASDNIIDGHRADMKQRKLDQLFAIHGLALVAVLKRAKPLFEQYAGEQADPACAYIALDIEELLLKLDQEATCQK